MRERVYDVLDGGSIDNLEEWLAGNTWDERTPLVAAIDNVLAQRDLIDASEVIEALRLAVSTVITSPDHGIVFGASTSQTVREAFVLGGSVTIRQRLELAGT